MNNRGAKSHGYGSANDLPSVIEMRQMLAGAKLLTQLVGRQHRESFLFIEAQVEEITAQVDAFYALLGDRHWVYPDYLPAGDLRNLVALPPDQAERALIDLHKQDGLLSRVLLRMQGHPAARARMAQINRAAENYTAGRYMECVLLLLTVMDGFVADVDPSTGRGLHARDVDEMVAWDSIVGHHKGLAHAHTVFTKTSRRTTNEPLVDLQRHGIVHGRQLNYDNDVVATKAWNQLLALRDWAKSLELEKQPAEPKPSWREMAAKLKRNAANKKALAEWSPSRLAADEPNFDSDPVVVVMAAYLDDWQHRRYGPMAARLSALFLKGTDGTRAGQVRAEYEDFPLDAFRIVKVDHQGAAICQATVELVIAGMDRHGVMRWMRESADGMPAGPADEAEWRLVTWGPYAFLKDHAA
jgi:hypothetical protein